MSDDGMRQARNNLGFDFEGISDNTQIDEARALRIVLAVLENDLFEMDLVMTEVATDERGFSKAHWMLVLGMARAYTAYALIHNETGPLAEGIRIALTGFATESADS